MKLRKFTTITLAVIGMASIPAIATATPQKNLPPRDFSPHSISAEQDRTGQVPVRTGNPEPETGLNSKNKTLPPRTGNPTGGVNTENDDNLTDVRNFSPEIESNVNTE